MPKCNVCKTIYEGPQRQIMISNNLFWCGLCSRFKIFNPLPANWFEPDFTIEHVIEKQKKHYEFGKSTGWFKN
jgi:hypothetical protein